MALLPRSRRGTWLLAGAVWVTACAGLWLALPVAPRAVVSVDPGARNFDFGPDGKTLVVHGFFRGENPYEETGKGNWPGYYWVWDCSTGKLLAGPEECPWGSWRASRDRRWWYSVIGESPDRKVQLYNVASRRLETVPGIEYADPEYARGVVSSDSKYFLIESEIAGQPTLVIWNLDDWQRAGMLPGVKLPADASAERQLIAACSDRESESGIQLFDLATLRAVGALHGEKNDEFRDFQFAGGGVFAVATYTKHWNDPGFIGDRLTPICLPVRVWNVGERQACSLTGCDQPARFALMQNRMFSVTPDTGITVAELREHEVKLNRRFGQDNDVAPVFDDRNLAPDGRTVVVQSYGQEASIIRRWLASLRISVLFKGLAEHYECRMFDTATGVPIAEIPGCQPRWSPDGRTLAAFLRSQYPSPIALWDIPPRKSLTWFATGAALLALPIGFVAWRRDRKLRAV